MTSNRKVAIVTGGSSGIGRATAVALVKEAGSDGIFVRTDVTTKMMSEHLWKRPSRNTEVLIMHLIMLV